MENFVCTSGNPSVPTENTIILCTKCKKNICVPGPSNKSTRELMMISENCCHLYHASCLDAMLEEQRKKSAPRSLQGVNTINCVFPACQTQTNIQAFAPIKPLIDTPETDENLIDDLENIVTKLQDDKRAIEEKYKKLLEYVKTIEPSSEQTKPSMPSTSKSLIHSSIEETDVPLDSILQPPPPPPFDLDSDKSDEDTSLNEPDDEQPIHEPYMGIFKPTGACPRRMTQTTYENEFFYFFSEFLVIGDGYVYNAIREATNHCHYKNTLLKSRLYSPQFWIAQLAKTISKLPALPLKIMLAVGGADTREKSASLDTIVTEFKRLLYLIYEKGTRTIITVPTIPYTRELPIRKQFNEILANKNIVNLDWTYEHAAGVIKVRQIHNTEVRKTFIKLSHQDSRHVKIYLADFAASIVAREKELTKQ